MVSEIAAETKNERKDSEMKIYEKRDLVRREVEQQVPRSCGGKGLGWQRNKRRLESLHVGGRELEKR